MSVLSFFFKFFILFLGIFSFHYTFLAVNGQTENPLNGSDSDVVFALDLSAPQNQNEIGGVTTEFYAKEFSTLPFPSSLEVQDPDPENQNIEKSSNENGNDNSTNIDAVASESNVVHSSESEILQRQHLNLKNEQKFARLQQLLNDLLKNYDKRIRPGYFDQGPTKVGVNVLVKNIASINEVDMQFQIDFYLRQTWRDSRLAFARLIINSTNSDSDSMGQNGQSKRNISNSNSNSNWTGDDLGFLNLSSELDKIWVPDTFFRNEKSSVVHSTTVPNRYVRVYPDGQIKTSQRLTITAQCVFNLRAYPMDVQVCGLNMGSYGYTTKALEYGWLSPLTNMNTDAVTIDLQSTFLPQFRVEGHRRSESLTLTSTGIYSSLSFEFLFVRSLDYYVSRIYAPAFIVVTVSYFQLWMGREPNSLLAEGRLGLGITSVLTITTIYLSNNEKSARVNYLKALDIYLALCFLAVFGTLLQTCLVIYLSKKIAMWEKEKQKREKSKQKTEKRRLLRWGKRKLSGNFIDIPPTGEADGDLIKTDGKDKDKNKEDGKEERPRELYWPSKIDLVSRFLFPVIFFLLNLIYWTHFLNLDARIQTGIRWIPIE